MSDGHALLSIQSGLFKGINVKACLGTTFFPSASPAFSFTSFLALPPTFLSPRGWTHNLFSREVKNSTL